MHNLLGVLFLLTALLLPTANPALAGDCQQILDEKLRTFEYGKAPLRTIYIRIDPAGNAQADGSNVHPYPSLYRAQLAGIQPGDELVIQGDVYNTWEGNTEMLLQGTAENPIFIRGERGARLLGSVPSWLHALKLAAGSQYVYIHDLEIRDGGGHTLHMNYVHDIVLDNVRVFNAREAVFKLSQSRNVFVRDSEFAGGGFYPDGNPVSTEVIDFVTVENFYLVRNKIHDGRHTLLMMKGPAVNGFIAWNDIYDQHDTEEPALSMGAYTGFPIIPDNAVYEGKNLVAFANNIHNVGNPVTFKGCHDCAVVHNSLSGAGPQLVRFLAGNAGAGTGLTYSETKRSIFEANIVSGGNADTPIMQCQDGYLGEGNTAERNIIYNPSGVNNWWCSSIPSTSFNVLNFNPDLDENGHAMKRRVSHMRGPAEFGRIAYKDLMLMDKAGSCLAGPPFNVGPYTLAAN